MEDAKTDDEIKNIISSYAILREMRLQGTKSIAVDMTNQLPHGGIGIQEKDMWEFLKQFRVLITSFKYIKTGKNSQDKIT